MASEPAAAPPATQPPSTTEPTVDAEGYSIRPDDAIQVGSSNAANNFFDSDDEDGFGAGPAKLKIDIKSEAISSNTAADNEALRKAALGLGGVASVALVTTKSIRGNRRYRARLCA